MTQRVDCALQRSDSANRADAENGKERENHSKRAVAERHVVKLVEEHAQHDAHQRKRRNAGNRQRAPQRTAGESQAHERSERPQERSQQRQIGQHAPESDTRRNGPQDLE